MIAVVDYDTGNLRSVVNALERVGARYAVTSDPAQIASAGRVLLPGVGEASSAMDSLRRKGLVSVIENLKTPVLGICIGMQLMCRSSQEGDVQCIGIFDTDVRRFDLASYPDLKIPHMGWNTIEGLYSPLFDGIPDGTYVYYVHSYAPRICPQAVASTTYGGVFSAALRRDNFYGTQFHPEKSGEAGERILKNFLAL